METPQNFKSPRRGVKQRSELDMTGATMCSFESWAESQQNAERDSVWTDESMCSSAKSTGEFTPVACALVSVSAPLRCESVSSLATASAVFQETVRLSRELTVERGKVDTLHDLLMQREAQKEAFFEQSMRKEKECVALREEILGLRANFDAQTHANEMKLKAKDCELDTLQTTVSQLESDNASMQQFSEMLETHVEQLRQSLAEAEVEKTALLQCKLALEDALAAKESASIPQPPCPVPTVSTPSPQPPEAVLSTPLVSAQPAKSRGSFYLSLGLLFLISLYFLALLLKSHLVVF